MRYTKPVRFIYDIDGDINAERQLRGEARKQIGKAFGTRSNDRKGNLAFRRFKYDDGSTIHVKKVHGVINCYIYVPKRVDKLKDFLGYITYPYMGWMYHARQFEHIYYGDTSGYDARDLARPLFTEWPGGYYFKRAYGWKAPYRDPNGNAIVEDGTNIGTIKEEEPSFPRWLLPDPSDKVVPKQKWRQKYITKASTINDYRPDRDVERWWSDFQSFAGYGGPNTQRDHEKYYKTTSHWKSADKDFMVHHEGHPGGDVGLVTESIMTDGSNVVFVNGVEYATPAPCHAASVITDTKTKTNWLFAWLNTDSWGEPGTDFHDTTATYCYCLIKNGKKPTPGKVWDPSPFAALNPKDMKEHQYDWITPLDGMRVEGSTQDYVAGGFQPQIQTNKTHYDTYGTPSAKTNERWVAYPRQRISIDSTGKKWLSTWVTDGAAGSQWNEFSNALTVQKLETNEGTLYKPTVVTTYLTGANAILSTDAMAWNTWKDCGTVVVNVCYNELDVKQYYTMRLQMKLDGAAVFPSDHDNFHISGVTAAHYKVDLEFDGNIWYNTADTDWTTYYTSTGEWPVYYDLKSEDAVIERMPSCSLTQKDPGIMTWSFGREVYIGGVLQSDSTGNSTYQNPATAGIQYGTRPYYNFGNWYYTLPGGPWVWRSSSDEWQYRCPAPFATWMPFYVPPGSSIGHNLMADYDTHPLDIWRPTWPTFFKNSEPPGFEVHELPGGHRMGYYVPRSLSEVEDWLDYTATTSYADGKDENFRVAPTYFITGTKSVYNIMKLKSKTDGQGKTMVPIIDVFYYRRKDQDIITPWRIEE